MNKIEELELRLSNLKRYQPGLYKLREKDIKAEIEVLTAKMKTSASKKKTSVSKEEK